MQFETSYLREKAHYCVALARKCADLPTSQALEALGVELMEKAAELEESEALNPALQRSSQRNRRA
jgi:hypothetical protein